MLNISIRQCLNSELLYKKVKSKTKVLNLLVDIFATSLTTKQKVQFLETQLQMRMIFASLIKSLNAKTINIIIPERLSKREKKHLYDLLIFLSQSSTIIIGKERS
jgi:hypothetical protein